MLASYTLPIVSITNFFVDVENQNFFFRMPIEADLEYLMVEGVYTNWQTNGDQQYLVK